MQMAVEPPGDGMSGLKTFLVLSSEFVFDLSYKARDPSIHFRVVGEDEVSDPESRLCIFCNLYHPWPSEKSSLRSGDIDGSVHYCCLPASVLQDEAQTVNGALRRCILLSCYRGIMNKSDLDLPE